MRLGRGKQHKAISYRFQIRIVAIYCLLILLSFSVAIIGIQRFLLLRLEARVEEALKQEVQELDILVGGKDPDTARPFGNNIRAIFSVFLKRNIPIANEYTIAILPEGFYKSVPANLPASINPNSAIVKEWQNLTVSTYGRIPNSPEQIVYRAEPIEIDGRIHGVFVVAIATKRDRQEINQAIWIIVRIMIIEIVVTLFLGWLFAGKILAPLRLLTVTAREISESNLEQRISVVVNDENDEVAQLSTTFNQMLERLQRAFSNQQNFLNDVSHELRTPITIIQGHLEFMGDTPEAQNEAKEIIFDELDRMNRLIADLMLLAKSEQPNFLQPETLEISNLTQQMYVKAKVIAERDWHLESVGTGLIVADRQRLIQAITNLAQNATKHTEPEDSITIGSAVTQNYAKFWVKDTGRGIPIEEQERIFQRFQTGSNSYNKSTGLGLSIVNAIAKAHGGKIELSSKLNEGSKFSLILPLNAFH